MLACTSTSSADVTSSQIRRSGSAASARAMATLCFWPPLSSDGQPLRQLRRQAYLPEQRGDALPLGGPSEPEELAQRTPQAARHRHARIERAVRILEDDLDAPAHRRIAKARRGGEGRAREQHLAGSRLVQPGEAASQGRLAAAAFAHDGQAAPFEDVERDALDRHSLDDPAEQGAPLPVPGDEILDADKRGAAAARSAGAAAPPTAGACSGRTLRRPPNASSAPCARPARSPPAAASRSRSAIAEAAARRERAARMRLPRRLGVSGNAARGRRWRRPAAGSPRAGPACRGAPAAETAPRTEASSTMWPAYITATRSARLRTTPRSWLT